MCADLETTQRRIGPPPAPVVPRRPSVRDLHGETVVDDYGWMRDRTDPDLLAYLAAERAYHDARCERLREVTDDLAAEAAARAPAGDEYSVAWRRAGGTYRTRMPAGGEGRQLLRSPDDGGSEQLVLDVGELAARTGFAELGVSEPSPDGALLAWSLDTAGDEIYTLRIRDLRSGEGLPERCPRTFWSWRRTIGDSS